MAQDKVHTDKVRASRDGHEFHEAWTARVSMQLLLPRSDLAGIAVEGLHPADENAASSEAADIADITLYYGDEPTFSEARSVKIVQFKYSVSDSDTDFRASHAKKTIAKFRAAFQDFADYRTKLQFELITNRPVYPPLLEAINTLANGLVEDLMSKAKNNNGKPVDISGLRHMR